MNGVINSPLIDGGPSAPLPRLYEYVSGERPDQASGPERIAWKLEEAACALGWPEGRLIGSEAQLSRALGVGRETLRAAIRIVERRGAMRMTRGRFGGLAITRPSLRQAASALAVYLRATGCRINQVDELIVVLRTLDTEDTHLLLRLVEDTGEMLRALEPASGSAFVWQSSRGMFINPDVRAAMIAMRIMDANAAESDRARLGSEWDLSYRFSASRLVMRQALRVLRDFDMLETRRGRGGGVFLKRPEPIAIIRQLFAYFASEGHTSDSLMGKLWTLNLANLQIASARLARMEAVERKEWIDATTAMLAQHDEPARWVMLQQAFARLSDNVLLDTLARCMASFQARRSTPVPPQPAIVDDRLLGHEQAILVALGSGHPQRAEAAHRAAQAVLAGLVRQMA